MKVVQHLADGHKLVSLGAQTVDDSRQRRRRGQGGVCEVKFGPKIVLDRQAIS